MPRPTTRSPNIFSRFWQFMLTTSEVAVAVHYRQPWSANTAETDTKQSLSEWTLSRPEQARRRSQVTATVPAE